MTFQRIIIACLVLLSSFSVSSAQDEVLAIVAGDTLLVEEFQMAYSDYLLKTGVRDNPALRKSMAQTMISSALLALEGRANGIEESPSYRKFARDVEQKLMLDAYARTVLFDTLQIRESQLEDLFYRTQTEITASHLFAPDRQTADSLFQLLQDGADWNALALRVFTDSTLAKSGGSLGTFSFDDMDPAFEDAAFSLLPGQISSPVKTATGYSIVRVEDRFTKPILTEYDYAKERDRLIGHARVRNQRSARTDHASRIESDLKIEWHRDVLNSLLAWIEGRPISREEGPETFMGRELVSFGPSDKRNSWTVADFRDEVEDLPESSRLAVQNRETLVDLVSGMLVRDEIVSRGKALGLSSLPAFKAAKKRNLRDWIVKQEIERIGTSVTVPADTLMSYFEAHSDQFITEETVQVREILVSDLETARKISEGLTRDSFSDLASQFTERPGASEMGGDLGFLTRSDLGVLADTVWNVSVETVLGPLEIGGRYVFLRVGERRPPQTMLFEEAKPMIEEQLWPGIAERTMGRYRRHLEEKYSDDILLREDVLYSISPNLDVANETLSQNPNKP